MGQHCPQVILQTRGASRGGEARPRACPSPPAESASERAPSSPSGVGAGAAAARRNRGLPATEPCALPCALGGHGGPRGGAGHPPARRPRGCAAAAARTPGCGTAPSAASSPWPGRSPPSRPHSASPPRTAPAAPRPEAHGPPLQTCLRPPPPRWRAARPRGTGCLPPAEPLGGGALRPGPVTAAALDCTTQVLGDRRRLSGSITLGRRQDKLSVGFTYVSSRRSSVPNFILLTSSDPH